MNEWCALDVKQVLLNYHSEGTSREILPHVQMGFQ